MSKKKKGRSGNRAPVIEVLDLSGSGSEPMETFGRRTQETPVVGFVSSIGRYRYVLGSVAIGLLIGLGVMAGNGWLPRTSPLSGNRTGWLGREMPQNASANPLGPPPPTPTLQLSKEYVYAGTKLVAAVDPNANEIPPADLAVWRPSTGVWHVLDAAQTTYPWGVTGDKPVQGDFDGDGKTDFCLYRPSNTTWYTVYSSNGSFVYPVFGSSALGDIPAVGDYDGDGMTDIAVFRPTDGKFYISQSSNSATVQYLVGQSGDKVAAADYDGDGKVDPGVWRNAATSQFRIRRSTDGQVQTINMGSASTDVPVSGDYDGDGKANFAIRHGADWIIMNATLSATGTITWGTAGDVPVQNDYDGDGKVDVAVWVDKKGAEWHILQSSDSAHRTEYWGTMHDIPVPAYFRR